MNFNQFTEKERREAVVVDYFLNHPTAYINEIVEATGIPKSSVQRYLQSNEDRIIPELNITIGQQLELNKSQGRRKGGINSFRNNDPVRDAQGKFIGLQQTSSTIDKEEKKRRDIKMLCTYFLENPTVTMDEMADIFKELGMYTSDYIYNCITDSRVVEIMGEEKEKLIREKLAINHRSFARKIGSIDISSIIDSIELDDVERTIYNKRYLENLSLDEVAEILGLSRARVVALEDKLVAKIKNNSKGSSK
jgi:hypothetical protein